MTKRWSAKTSRQLKQLESEGWNTSSQNKVGFKYSIPQGLGNRNCWMKALNIFHNSVISDCRWIKTEQQGHTWNPNSSSFVYVELFYQSTVMLSLDRRAQFLYASILNTFGPLLWVFMPQKNQNRQKWGLSSLKKQKKPINETKRCSH